MNGRDVNGRLDIPRQDLAALRGILVSSLSKENLGPIDLEPPPTAPRRRHRHRHVTFLDAEEFEDAGATPVDPKQNGRPSTAKQGIHWFAHGATDTEFEPDARSRRRSFYSTRNGSTSWFSEDDGPTGIDQGKEAHRDREERLRILKEKQNEERQRKLEELKQQALAAQKFREQKEEERRKRLEELRVRDTDRRHQVEERKRQIWEAERDRREAILRKNQEREARIESKRKNERSSIVFAFGSSTPRMLEPGDTGSTYWASRRATSTTNVMSLSLAPGPLTRRSSERELDGSKKRATSASCAERKNSQDETDEGASQGVTGGRAIRRKTDLVPTVPSPRESAPSIPLRVKRGGGGTPGRAFSMSRLDLLAQPRRPRVVAAVDPELTRSMSTLAQPSPAPHSHLRKGTTTSRSMVALGPPLPPPRPTRALRLRQQAQLRSQSLEQPLPSSPGLRSGEITPSRPQSSMSQHSMASNLSAASLRARAAPRKPRPISIAVTGVSERMSLSAEHRNSKSFSSTASEKPPIPKVQVSRKQVGMKPEPPKKPAEKPKPIKGSSSGTPKTTPLQSPVVEAEDNVTVVERISQDGVSTVVVDSVTVKTNEVEKEIVIEETVITTKVDESLPLSQQFIISEDKEKEVAEVTIEDKPDISTKVESAPENGELENISRNSGITTNTSQVIQVATSPTSNSPQTNLSTTSSQGNLMQSSFENGVDLEGGDMTSSMSSKRITTEEEAKAALAERRRQAREQAEREAELERQRIEAEKLAEEERIRREEEEQRRMEEEQLRLLEEARKSEELRLQQAILETQKREEEEKKRREEELKQKIEKEEAEKKAKEEAEKLRQEMELRLKKEEEDRQARRKRVEAIMLRTRGKGNTPTTTPTKDGEEVEESPLDESKLDNSMKSQNDQFLNSERSHSDANRTSFENIKQNGHHNGSVDSVTQNNVTNSLLDLDAVTEPVGQILDLPSGNGKIADAPLQAQYIAFQDKKEPHTVNDLLS